MVIFMNLLFQSVLGPGAVSVLCVGPRCSLCPAPGSLCWGPALSTSGPGALCRGPALSVLGPAPGTLLPLSVSDPTSLALCVGLFCPACSSDPRVRGPPAQVRMFDLVRSWSAGHRCACHQLPHAPMHVPVVPNPQSANPQPDPRPIFTASHAPAHPPCSRPCHPSRSIPPRSPAPNRVPLQPCAPMCVPSPIPAPTHLHPAHVPPIRHHP